MECEHNHDVQTLEHAQLKAAKRPKLIENRTPQPIQMLLGIELGTGKLLYYGLES